MSDSASRSLRQDAVTIWQAGVSAVRSDQLVRNVVRRSDDTLVVCGHEFSVSKLGKIVVVGAGKAGAGMAAGLEESLGDDVVDGKVVGWVNVPADCVRPLRKIHLHAARPAGINEPTEAGVEGTEKILELVSQVGPDDLCLVLLSGGGSALLPAPVPGVSLPDKQAVTRFLSQAGANITELNTVRKQLSRIKGGGLARALSAGTMVTLIISDVVGDPLDVIASGPTAADSSTPADALAVLNRFEATSSAVPQSVFDFLTTEAAKTHTQPASVSGVFNHIIGNNDVAINAAVKKAQELGYPVHAVRSRDQGEATRTGFEIAEVCKTVRDVNWPVPPPACFITGGEPVVLFAKTDQPRKGGRNQQLVLSALNYFWDDGMNGIAILSGGTDGEDGPTDAAGAVADSDLLLAARRLGLNPHRYLDVQNAYPFFEAAGGLLKTGPTHTNVMDLRVAIVARK
ncbi:MAG: DUF4147 domain-containing protein [Planctomycetales bacterium]|nr:DUF4147 domain-containing protein [Planctomycetales bacterium]